MNIIKVNHSKFSNQAQGRSLENRGNLNTEHDQSVTIVGEEISSNLNDLKSDTQRSYRSNDQSKEGQQQRNSDQASVDSIDSEQEYNFAPQLRVYCQQSKNSQLSRELIRKSNIERLRHQKEKQIQEELENAKYKSQTKILQPLPLNKSNNQSNLTRQYDLKIVKLPNNQFQKRASQSLSPNKKLPPLKQKQTENFEKINQTVYSHLLSPQRKKSYESMMTTFVKKCKVLQDSDRILQDQSPKTIEFNQKYIDRVHAIGEGQTVTALQNQHRCTEVQFFQLDFQFFSIACSDRSFPVSINIENANSQVIIDGMIELFISSKAYPNWDQYQYFYSCFYETISLSYRRGQAPECIYLGIFAKSSVKIKISYQFDRRKSIYSKNHAFDLQNELNFQQKDSIYDQAVEETEEERRIQYQKIIQAQRAKQMMVEEKIKLNKTIAANFNSWVGNQIIQQRKQGEIRLIRVNFNRKLNEIQKREQQNLINLSNTDRIKEMFNDQRKFNELQMMLSILSEKWAQIISVIIVLQILRAKLDYLYTEKVRETLSVLKIKRRMKNIQTVFLQFGKNPQSRSINFTKTLLKLRCSLIKKHIQKQAKVLIAEFLKEYQQQTIFEEKCQQFKQNINQIINFFQRLINNKKKYYYQLGIIFDQVLQELQLNEEVAFKKQVITFRVVEFFIRFLQNEQQAILDQHIQRALQSFNDNLLDYIRTRDQLQELDPKIFDIAQYWFYKSRKRNLRMFLHQHYDLKQYDEVNLVRFLSFSTYLRIYNFDHILLENSRSIYNEAIAKTQRENSKIYEKPQKLNQKDLVTDKDRDYFNAKYQNLFRPQANMIQKFYNSLKNNPRFLGFLQSKKPKNSFLEFEEDDFKPQQSEQSERNIEENITSKKGMKVAQKQILQNFDESLDYGYDVSARPILQSFMYPSNKQFQLLLLNYIDFMVGRLNGKY